MNDIDLNFILSKIDILSKPNANKYNAIGGKSGRRKKMRGSAPPETCVPKLLEVTNARKNEVLELFDQLKSNIKPTIRVIECSGTINDEQIYSMFFKNLRDNIETYQSNIAQGKPIDFTSTDLLLILQFLAFKDIVTLPQEDQREKIVSENMDILLNPPALDEEIENLKLLFISQQQQRQLVVLNNEEIKDNVNNLVDKCNSLIVYPGNTPQETTIRSVSFTFKLVSKIGQLFDTLKAQYAYANNTIQAINNTTAVYTIKLIIRSISYLIYLLARVMYILLGFAYGHKIITFILLLFMYNNPTGKIIIDILVKVLLQIANTTGIDEQIYIITDQVQDVLYQNMILILQFPIFAQLQSYILNISKQIIQESVVGAIPTIIGEVNNAVSNAIQEAVVNVGPEMARELTQQITEGVGIQLQEQGRLQIQNAVVSKLMGSIGSTAISYAGYAAEAYLGIPMTPITDVVSQTMRITNTGGKRYKSLKRYNISKKTKRRRSKGKKSKGRKSKRNTKKRKSKN